MFAKLNAMQAAIHVKFSFGTAPSSTLGEIDNLLVRVYKGGTSPMQEEWSMVLKLNALEDTDYNFVQTQILSQFMNAKTIPTKKDIVEAIEFARHEHLCKTSVQAHVA